MKFKNNRLIKITGLIFIFVLLSVINLSAIAFVEKDSFINHYELDSLQTSQSWAFQRLVISETGGGNGTWAWAATQDWCFGSGTENDPYVIENVTINSSGISGVSGITIIDSNVYFIIQNSFIHNSGSASNDAGIKLINSINGIIQHNNLSYNLGIGIYLNNSTDNRILDNDVLNNQYHGIYIYNYSDSNIISNNRVRLNGFGSPSPYHGIYIHSYSEYNLITNNLVSDNSYDGIRVRSYAHNNTIASNEVLNNHYIGITIDNRAHDCIIKENFIVNNQEYGILLSSEAHRTTIQNNHFENHTVRAIYAVGTNFLNISNNFFTNNYYSIFLRYVSNSDIANNKLVDNDWSAIYIEFLSHNNKIVNNYILNNPNGIYLDDRCNNNMITDNTIILQNIYISSSGISMMRSCNNNTLQNNYLLNNNYGIQISSNCDYSNVSNNIIKSSADYGLQIAPDCDNTLIYQNYFIYNGIQIRNFASSTQWNFTTLGNYWSNYTGYDADDDGIGDLPHPIISDANGFDYYPIFKNMPSIYINEYSDYNWEWAAQQYWVNGTGTEEDPYIIHNKIIDRDWQAPAIEIRNSEKHFIISNCSLSTQGAIFPGIVLYNVDNGIIENTTIYNSRAGIEVYGCNNLTISANKINYNGAAIHLSQNQYLCVSNNNLDHNAIGLYIYQSNNNLFCENSILNTESCILEYMSYDNVFENNLCDPKPLKQFYITITDQLFTMDVFNITIFIHNATYDGIEVASILVVWNGTDVSTNVTLLGNGYYMISLDPIFVPPGDPGIPIEISLSSVGYESLLYSSNIAVDPDTVDKPGAPVSPPGAIPGYDVILLLATISFITIYISVRKFAKKKRNTFI